MINTIILSWLAGKSDCLARMTSLRMESSSRYSSSSSSRCSIDNAVRVLWKSVANLHCLQSKPDPIQNTRVSVATSPSVHAATSFTWPPSATTAASYSPRCQLTSRSQRRVGSAATVEWLRNRECLVRCAAAASLPLSLPLLLRRCFRTFGAYLNGNRF